MREKVKLLSTADTGHFYVTTKNKRLHPDKLEVRKFDPVARKHVAYKESRRSSNSALTKRLPELPEVETTRRGLRPYALRRRIVALEVYEPRLRWPVPRNLPNKVAGQRIVRAGRRAKYLLLELESGTLLLHLGMSGNLRVVPAQTPRVSHDHFDLVLDSGLALRFNDPRRFGSLLYTRGDPRQHPLLAALAPEPLTAAFDADYLWRTTRRRRVAIKQLLMNSRLVVGVGNIYASEALFRARIGPKRQAKTLSRAEAARLVRGVRTVLA